MIHKLPALPYAYNALEPYIDEQTMHIHHTKHHQTYVDKLNAALEGYDELQKKSAEALITDLNSIPEKIETPSEITVAGMPTTAFSGPFYGKRSILRVKLPMR